MMENCVFLAHPEGGGFYPLQNNPVRLSYLVACLRLMRVPYRRFSGRFWDGLGLEVTYPECLTQGLYPEKVSYVLGTEKHTFILHLRKNR